MSAARTAGSGADRAPRLGANSRVKRLRRLVAARRAPRRLDFAIALDFVHWCTPTLAASLADSLAN
jgi:hypothetical protein